MSHVRGCQPSFVVKLQTSRYSRNYYFNSELSSETFVLIVVRLLGVQFEVFLWKYLTTVELFWKCKEVSTYLLFFFKKCVMSLVWATDFSGLHWVPSSSRFTFYQPEHELFNTELDHSHFHIKHYTTCWSNIANIKMLRATFMHVRRFHIYRTFPQWKHSVL